jgi:hypothetical protein
MKRLFLIFVALLGCSSLGFAGTESELKTLVSNMQTSILVQNNVAYLELVDLSDPLFRVEHLRFIDDWMNILVKKLKLDFVLQHETEVEARGLITWNYQDINEDEFISKYEAIFHKIKGRWRYAGEYWRQIQKDKIKVLYMPGFEKQAQHMLEKVPEIIKYISESLEIQNKDPMTIKFYYSLETISQSVGLSWTNLAGWHEPNEAIKVFESLYSTNSRSILAHEITHYFMFQRFNFHRFPFWLEEGFAEYTASKYWSTKGITRSLNLALRWILNTGFEYWEDWEDLSNLKTTPTMSIEHASVQGFAFVTYLTKTYGLTKRNRWLTEISSGKNLNQAAKIAFGKSFDQLDKDLKDWLKRRGLVKV